IGEIVPGSGLYGLIVELRGFEDAEGNPIEAKIADCLEFTAAPGVPGIFDMIGPILILGLLAFMLPMLKEGFE
ncbi:unnamed protein product, partial [marine sediment metagenome]